MADFLKFDSIIQEIANHPLTRYINDNSINLPSYDAYWEIKERQLYIYKLNDHMEELGLQSLFGTSEDEIFCEWFEGKIEIPAINFDNKYYDTILSLNVVGGYVTSHRFFLIKKADPVLIESGRYKGYTLSELIKPRFVLNKSLIQDYLRSFLSFLFDYNYDEQIITPDYKFSKEEKDFLKNSRRSQTFKYYITERYIYLDTNDQVYRSFDERNELFGKAFKLISKILSSQFTSTRLLFRNRHFDKLLPRSTVYLNPDITFVSKYANELLKINCPENIEISGIWEPALIPPDTFRADIMLMILQFNFKSIKYNLIEYSPDYLWLEPPFNDEFISPFIDLFEQYYDVIYDKHYNQYVYDVYESHYIIGEYLIDVQNIYHGFKRKESGENFYDPSMDESYDSGNERYNGAYGFDDDTIDNAFEGDPENYWNID